MKGSALRHSVESIVLDTASRNIRHAVDRLVLDTALVADNPWTVAGRTPVERIVAQRESARAVAFAKVRANNITKKKVKKKIPQF